MFDKYEKKGAYHWHECDRWSAAYNPPLAARYQMIARRVEGGRVLDVGAGDGYLTGLVAPKCREVVALEYEPSGVKLARKMLAGRSNVHVEAGDCYALPYEDAQFDWVLMADVIEHLETPRRAVAEMARVVRSDGVVHVTTPQWRADRIWDERHVKEYGAIELRDMLLEHFASVEMRYAWPRAWSDFYRTRFGWRLMKWVGRFGFNPFAKESANNEGYCQMLAICRQTPAAEQ